MDVLKWGQQNAEGFFAFVDNVKPMVPGPKGKLIPFELGPSERAEVIAALDGRPEGPYKTIVFCWPRRHGKTIVSALIIVWRFLTRQRQTIAVVANSQKQTIDTAFKTVIGLLQDTPYIKRLVDAGSIVIQGEKIAYQAMKSTIQGFPANPAALYGKKLSIAQVSELHAAPNDDAYQVLAGCTVDSADGLTLVDSTVGSRNSPLFHLYSLSQNRSDPSLYYSHIFYEDLEDACEHSPAWIDRDSLRSRAVQDLPARFAQQHLNLWQAGSNALFPPSVLDRCVSMYPLRVEDIAAGSAFSVGAGLDRATGFSMHGDATVTTCLVKVLQGEDEHFYVVDSSAIAFSSASGIKHKFIAYRKDFGLSRVAIETFNSQDIGTWCAGQDFDHEIVAPTAERQATAFTTLYNIASEGRLHIHPKFDKLIKELSTFEYRMETNGDRRATLPKFEGAKGCKDDFCYSLCWSLYSLREQELNAYELQGIHCFADRPAVVQLCALNGGDMVPPCGETCPSMRQASGLYKAYRRKDHIVPLHFHEFISSAVKNVGAHTMPRQH